MSALSPGNWLGVTRTDPRAFALYRRHYSSEKNKPGRADTPNFMGPGECMVLLADDCRAVFAWQHNTMVRWDGQDGVICTIFRNESPVLSSELIREADGLAWQRWPGERHFTYIDGQKTRRRRSKRAPVGKCFIEAGWRECGVSAQGLTILHILPEWAQKAAA